MQLVLGEFRRYTWHVFGGPCEDVPILTEEIDELAFLFAVKVRTYDSVPLRVLWVQGYFLSLFGRLERAFSFRLLGVGRQLRLLAGHRHNSVKKPLLRCDNQGLGQTTALGRTSGRLPVVADNSQDSLGTRHLHLEVGVVGDRHELGQGRSAKQCMVRTLEVHHFKPDRLSAEVILISEKDIYQNLADWGAGKTRDDPMEYSPAVLELSLLDSQLLHCILVQDVDTAAAIYQNSRKASCPPISGKGGLQDQGIG